MFHVQAHHQCIVEFVELFGLRTHHGGRCRRYRLTCSTRHLRRNLVLRGRYVRRDATQVTEIVFEVHILCKPNGNCTERKARKGRILEELEDFRLVPGLGQQGIFRSLRDSAYALDKDACATIMMPIAAECPNGAYIRL